MSDEAAKVDEQHDSEGSVAEAASTDPADNQQASPEAAASVSTDAVPQPEQPGEADSDLADPQSVPQAAAEEVATEDLGDPNDPELDGEPEPEPEVAPAGPLEVAEEEDEEIKKDWYILKVQSNRERSIAAALQRKVAIEGIQHLFGEIMVPTEKVTEFKAGKKKVVERKLWPGYIAVNMHVNDDTWFAIRETSGIGDFTGSGGAPTPMAEHEVAKILHTDESEEGAEDAPKLNIKFSIGDKVKVKDGNFESFEGEVAEIDEASGKVSIMISIFGRSTPVELEYWQVETL